MKDIRLLFCSVEVRQTTSMSAVSLMSHTNGNNPLCLSIWKLALLLHMKGCSRCFSRCRHQTYFAVVSNLCAATQFSGDSACKTTHLNAAKNAHRRSGGMTCCVVERMGEVSFSRWRAQSTWWRRHEAPCLSLHWSYLIIFRAALLEQKECVKAIFWGIFCSWTSTYCSIYSSFISHVTSCSFVFSFTCPQSWPLHYEQLFFPFCARKVRSDQCCFL